MDILRSDIARLWEVKIEKIWRPISSGRLSPFHNLVCWLCFLIVFSWLRLAELRVVDEKPADDEGPIRNFNPDETISEPSSLVEGFNWVTMDLTDEKEAGTYLVIGSKPRRLNFELDQ